MIRKLLNEKNLPELKSREEMLDILQREEYGYLPEKPEEIEFKECEEFDRPWIQASSLKLVDFKKVDICCKISGKEFVFPIMLSMPTDGKANHPLIVNLAFRRLGPHFFIDSELVAKEGFATATLYYMDITTDDNDFTSGLSGVLYENGERNDSSAGKLAIWAWAVQRVFDYADYCGDFDNSCYVVSGHERLAKAALLASATDERITYVFANSSGQSGAALSKDKKGETLKDITKTCSAFFCKNYCNRENVPTDFDQHFLLASIAPRYVYLSGASNDKWSDTEGEFLSALKASEAFEKLGKKGLICGEKFAEAGEFFHEGNIGYHLRKGDSFLSRYDGELFIDFIKKHRGEYVEKKTMNICEHIKSRKLPALKSREEMLDILQREEYGYLPEKPDAISFKETHDYLEPSFCAGKAVAKKIDVTVSLYGGEFTFPIYSLTPMNAGRYPFFVFVNFKKEGVLFDRFLPTEEIIDNGFGIITFDYQDITTDDDNFENGLAGLIYKNKERTMSSPSKIAMWAWAAQRALDYAETKGNFDMDCAVVCGHSRLGKTALLAGATDERFKYVHSNDSGACGAALSRGKNGETMTVMTRVLRWYCNNFAKYNNNEDAAEFDQHYLLASIAPRYVYVASAYEDTWADPVSEFLSCVAASEEFEKYGKKGLVCGDRLPEIGDEYHEGSIGYHLRAGTHYFGREDWVKLMKFIKKHEKEDSGK